MGGRIIRQLRRPKNTGFTLIEILLVVVLLGIVAAVSLPNFSKSYANLQLQNEANEIAYLMRYAQSRAVTQGRYIRLIFTDEAKEYFLLQGPTEIEKEESLNGYERIRGRWGRSSRIPADISLSSQKDYIEFSPNGKIDKVRIILCRKDQCITVSTYEMRGRVSVFSNIDNLVE